MIKNYLTFPLSYIVFTTLIFPVLIFPVCVSAKNIDQQFEFQQTQIDNQDYGDLKNQVAEYLIKDAGSLEEKLLKITNDISNSEGWFKGYVYLVGYEILDEAILIARENSKFDTEFLNLQRYYLEEITEEMINSGDENKLTKEKYILQVVVTGRLWHPPD